MSFNPLEFASQFETPEDLKHFIQVQEAKTGLLEFAKFITPDYQTPAHIVKIADLLERVERGECRRAMIFMPPRHGKSMLASQIFPAYYLGRDPKREIMSISYNDDHAKKFGRKARNLVRSEEFQEVFPGITINHESQASDNWELKYISVERNKERNRYGGVYQAAGIDGAVTGKGADLILIDDPIKGRKIADSLTFRDSVWNFYESDLYTRQLPGAAIVLIQTRWHEDDLAGRLLRKMKEGGEQWEILELPAFLDDEETIALWPERYPPEELKRFQRAMTNRSWQSLYQQKPVADEGNIIKRAWWNVWDGNKSPPEEYDLTVMSVDTAYTTQEWGSYSAITIWGIFQWNNTPAIMLRDAWHNKVEYPELRKTFLEFKDKYEPDVMIIEKKASGMTLSQDMKRMGLPIFDYRPDRDKMVRAQAAAAMIEAGLVYALDNRKTELVIDEAAAFPTGASDDFVDTLSQALLVIRDNGYLNTRKLYRDIEEDDEPQYERRYVYY